MEGSRVDLSQEIADGSQECLLFGFDVEKAGKLMHHSLMAVGITVLSLDRAEIVASDTWCVGPPDDQCWEPRCIAEFWKNQIHVLNRIRANGMPKHCVLDHVYQFLSKWELKVKPSTESWQGGVVLVSDAPSYDESMLNHEFQNGRDPALKDHTLHYTLPQHGAPSKWRSVEDCCERAAALGMQRAFLDKFFEQHGIKHDHWPSNDAAKHAWTHAICYAMTEWLEEGKDREKSRTSQLNEFKSLMEAQDGKKFICEYALKHYRRNA